MFVISAFILVRSVNETPPNLWYKAHFSRQYYYWSLRCSWKIACRCCFNNIFIFDLTPGFNGLDKGIFKTRWETSKLSYLVRLILEIWSYHSNIFWEWLYFFSIYLQLVARVHLPKNHKEIKENLTKHLVANILQTNLWPAAIVAIWLHEIIESHVDSLRSFDYINSVETSKRRSGQYLHISATSLMKNVVKNMTVLVPAK